MTWNPELLRAVAKAIVDTEYDHPGQYEICIGSDFGGSDFEREAMACAAAALDAFKKWEEALLLVPDSGASGTTDT